MVASIHRESSNHPFWGRRACVMALCMLVCVFLIPESSVSADEPDMIMLSGSPDQIGTTWAKINKQSIIKFVNTAWLDRAKEAGIDTQTLIQRGARYVEIVEKIAPHWLEESRAVARETGLDQELYLAFCGSVSRSRFLKASPEEDEIIECTSFAVPQDKTKGRAIFFHKTRDNTDYPQVAVIVDNATPGVNKLIAIADIGALRGFSMAVNEKGLAVAGDYPAHKKKDSSTLVLPKAQPKFRGLMAGEILRYIVEKASTSQEALDILTDFVGKGYYAGGDVNASHWLFVDRNGVIIEVCNNAEHIVSMVHDKTYFSRFNKSDPAIQLKSADVVDFAMFRNVSRERPVVTRQSISGMTVEIDPDYPELLTVAWVSIPARVAAYPIFMGQKRMPEPWLNGQAYAAGKLTANYNQDNWKAHKARFAEIEAQMHQEKEQLVNDVRESIEAGNPRDADIEMLEAFSREQARRLMSILKDLAK